MPSEAELRQSLSTIGFVLGEAVAGTLREVEIQLPVNAEGGIAVNIRKITFHIDTIGNIALPAADSFDEPVMIAGISQVQGLAGIPLLSDGRTLAVARYFGVVGSAPADAGVTASLQLEGEKWDYDPGVLIIDQTVSLYVISAGYTTVGTWRGQIHYQVIKITAQEALGIAARALSA